MMLVRLLVIASLGAMVFASGCSNTAPATPQAGIQVTVIPGSNSSAQCPVALPDNTWNIGGDNLAPIADGADQSGAPVSVSCAVSGNDGSGYNVTASVELKGKGSFNMTGHLSAPGSSSPSTFHAAFTLPLGLGAWGSDGCTVDYSVGGIAPGRLWATIHCPAMVDSNNNHVCDGTADVRLENCNQ
jgi:hypothetical protein